MQEVEKDNKILVEHLDHLTKRLNILLPDFLASRIYEVLDGKLTIENTQLVTIVPDIINQNKEVAGLVSFDDTPKADKGSMVNYLYELMNFFREFVILIEAGITKKMGSFLRIFAKELKEQKNKGSGQSISGINDSLDTLKTLNVKYLSLKVKGMIADLVLCEHRLQLGIVLLLTLSFALYLRSDPFISKCPPKYMKEFINLLDSDSLEATNSIPSSLSHEIIRTCFIDILIPLMESSIHGIKGNFHFDYIIEYTTLIAFLFDFYGNTTIHFSSIKGALNIVPLTNALRVLIACQMRTPFMVQKNYYKEHILALITNKQEAIQALINTLTATEWNLEQVLPVISKIIISVPSSNSSYYLKLVLRLFKLLYLVSVASVREKISFHLNAKKPTIDANCIKFFLLAKITEGQPELGKKIIVRKFILKLYDIELMDLLVLERRPVIWSTGNKFRNMDKKPLDGVTLGKDLSYFVQFLKKCSKCTNPCFEAIAECCYSLLLLSDIASDKPISNSCIEIMRWYLCSDKTTVKQEITIIQRLIEYLLRDTINYEHYLKALLNYLLDKKEDQQTDGKGLGNNMLGKPTTRPKEAKEEEIKLELFNPYTFSIKYFAEENKFLFNKQTIVSLIEDGYFSETNLNKAIKTNNEVLDKLLKFKDHPNAFCVFKALTMEVLRFINNNTMCLVNINEVTDVIKKVYDIRKEKYIELILENKKYVKDYILSMLLALLEKLLNNVCCDILAADNKDLLNCLHEAIVDEKNGATEIILKALFKGIETTENYKIELYSETFIKLKQLKQTLNGLDNHKDLCQSLVEKINKKCEEVIAEDLKSSIIAKLKTVRGLKELKDFIVLYSGLIPEEIKEEVYDKVMDMAMKDKEMDIVIDLLLKLSRGNSSTMIREAVYKLDKETWKQFLVSVVRKNLVESFDVDERIQLLLLLLEDEYIDEALKVALKVNEVVSMQSIPKSNEVLNKVIQLGSNTGNEKHLQIIYMIGLKMSENISVETLKNIESFIKTFRCTSNCLALHYCDLIEAEIIKK